SGRPGRCISVPLIGAGATGGRCCRDVKSVVVLYFGGQKRICSDIGIMKSRVESDVSRRRIPKYVVGHSAKIDTSRGFELVHDCAHAIRNQGVMLNVVFRRILSANVLYRAAADTIGPRQDDIVLNRNLGLAVTRIADDAVMDIEVVEYRKTR